MSAVILYFVRFASPISNFSWAFGRSYFFGITFSHAICRTFIIVTFFEGVICLSESFESLAFVEFVGCDFENVCQILIGGIPAYGSAYIMYVEGFLFCHFRHPFLSSLPPIQEQPLYRRILCRVNSTFLRCTIHTSKWLQILP